MPLQNFFAIGVYPSVLNFTQFIAPHANTYSMRLVIRSTVMLADDSRMFTNSPSRPGTISAPCFVAIACPEINKTFHCSGVSVLPSHLACLATSAHCAWKSADCSSDRVCCCHCSQPVLPLSSCSATSFRNGFISGFA